MTDPVRILVKRDELTLEGNKQFFVANEHQMRTGCGLDTLLFIPKYVPKPISAQEEREVQQKVVLSAARVPSEVVPPSEQDQQRGSTARPRRA